MLLLVIELTSFRNEESHLPPFGKAPLMSFRSVLYLTLGIMVFCASEASISAQEKELRQRLESEAPPKWESYREFSKRLQGGYLEESFDRSADNKRTARARVQMKSTDHAKLFSNEFSQPQERNHCWVRNERYAFELRRKKESEPWVIAQLHLDDAKTATSQVHKFLGGERFVGGPISVYEYWLPDLVKRAGFRVVEIKTIQHENANLVHVEFAYAQSEKEKKNRDIHGHRGWFILDPENYWLVREYEVKVLWPPSEKGIVRSQTEWRKNKDGFPIMTKQTKFIQGVEGAKTNLETRTEYKYDDKEPGPEEFTLSAFGLPEPKGIVWNHAGTRWWLWISVAAAGTLVSALLFLRLKRYFQLPKPVKP